MKLIRTVKKIIVNIAVTKKHNIMKVLEYTSIASIVDNLQFSLFYDVKKGIFNTTPQKQITFNELIKIYTSDFINHITKELQNAKEDDKSELKKQLPFITPYGTFKGSRKKDNINLFNSSLICLDIDNLTIQEAREIKDILSLNQSTMLCAISPRGKGVKAFILINDTIPLKECYNTLKLNKKRIAESIGIGKYIDNIDNAQFNITQPMFIAFDIALYYNVNVLPLNVKLDIYKEPIIQRQNITSTPLNAKNRIEAYLINATTKLEQFFAVCSEGNRHANIIKVQSISSWLHYAPQIENEIKERLYNACCLMYGNEKEALKNGVKRAFEQAWNTPPKANNSIESIINELNSVA